MTTHQIHRAFVTGGSGFAGRHPIAALQACGIPVRALAHSKVAREVVQQAGAEPSEGDLSDRHNLEFFYVGLYLDSLTSLSNQRGKRFWVIMHASCCLHNSDIFFSRLLLFLKSTVYCPFLLNRKDPTKCVEV
jgi:nucleoside-diphosphate-sugar epimerase